MNAHVTFGWEQMGVVDPQLAVSVLGQYNHEVAKWLRRHRPDLSGRGGEHIYAYVHENGGGNGFHTHQLMYVRPALRKELDLWSRRFLMRALGMRGIYEKSLRIIARSSRSDEQNVARCWAWFRYVAKQLPDGVGAQDQHGTFHEARSIFKLWASRQMKPLPVADAVKVSHNIGRIAQRTAGFVSTFQTGAFDRLYLGNELDDWRHRNLLATLQAGTEDMGLQLG